MKYLNQHILFWIFIALLLSLGFASNNWSLEESVYFVMMLLPVVVITGYFFNYFLVPKYLFTKRYRLFALYTLYMIIVSLHLELVVVVFSYMILANYRYENLNPNTSNVFALSAILYGIVLIISFVKLVRIYFEQQNVVHDLERYQQKEKQEQITVKENRRSVTVNLSEIRFIESLSDYVKIHLEGRQITTKVKISTLKNDLPSDFIRIHRSFVVNKNFVTRYTREFVELEGQELPIGRTYKKDFIINMES